MKIVYRLRQSVAAFVLLGRDYCSSSLNSRCKWDSNSHYVLLKGPLNCSRGLSLDRGLHCSEPPEEILSPLDLFSEREDAVDLIPRSLRTGNTPHQVLIVHPHIKWGPQKKHNTSPQLEMEEAESLIKTLQDWKVISTQKISLLSYDKQTFFNSGQLETIRDMIKENEHISGLFINVKSLKLSQHLFLEKLYNVSIFDRYSIVINIFKRHAISKEAKLQVALAEIPYIRSRVRGINDIEMGEFTKNISFGSRESYLSKRLKALSFHEQKLKKMILKLRKNRDLLRAKRKSLKLPVVAVVGYTNAGKTSLIKCITNETKMQPEDKLFATLDVTVHAGILPCNMKALFVDTIGFLSDIPTNLIEPFIATLEDALEADLIVHVQDISHPNHQRHKAHVIDTLKNMRLNDKLLDSMISVGNKCDKVCEGSHENGLLLTSCTKQLGLDELLICIENSLVSNMGLLQLRVKVRNGSEEYFWLRREAAVADYQLDETDQDSLLLDLTISSAKLEQFKQYFIRRVHE